MNVFINKNVCKKMNCKKCKKKIYIYIYDYLYHFIRTEGKPMRRTTELGLAWPPPTYNIGLSATTHVEVSCSETCNPSSISISIPAAGPNIHPSSNINHSYRFPIETYKLKVVWRKNIKTISSKIYFKTKQSLALLGNCVSKKSLSQPSFKVQ